MVSDSLDPAVFCVGGGTSSLVDADALAFVPMALPNTAILPAIPFPTGTAVTVEPFVPLMDIPLLIEGPFSFPSLALTVLVMPFVGVGRRGTIGAVTLTKADSLLPDRLCNDG